ncbi:hypothetical protein J4573_44440 [Actinomadura barringtoniae]|uniref:VapC45 PIN like domain-containing protein n=1 Tax=Actinomadura barringtoniae TaxID=1427535 RepID=A0A939PKW9_9ACTN|nr:hypothetical protein [Actinomadura barringtoniae]MBO2454202.1 hypothetical protein [Actinomadura barringtoniae]
MRILIDENSPVQLVQVLEALLPRHTVHHVISNNWKSKNDIPLLLDARTRRYDLFLTRDGRQLEDPDETDAIKKAKVHHVRFAQRHKGREGLALAMGAVIGAMPGLVAELEDADGQRLVRIAGLNPAGRFEVTDPRKDPPKYWPR